MEMLFVWLLVSMMGFYAFRYVWVHVQCRRANWYATHLSVSHIEKCSEAYLTIQNSNIMDEQKEHLRSMVKKCLDRTQDYYDKGYWKDWNDAGEFNGFWMACDKWTLRQMFPKLTNMKSLEVVWE